MLSDSDTFYKLSRRNKILIFKLETSRANQVLIKKFLDDTLIISIIQYELLLGMTRMLICHEHLRHIFYIAV